MAWFWIWLIFAVLLVAAPFTFGYRRWGPPYPYWTARARTARLQGRPSWGWYADLLWLMVAVALFWFVAAAVI